jgi:hypothetical protein
MKIYLVVYWSSLSTQNITLFKHKTNTTPQITHILTTNTTLTGNTKQLLLMTILIDDDNYGIYTIKHQNEVVRFGACLRWIQFLNIFVKFLVNSQNSDCLFPMGDTVTSNNFKINY